MSFGDLVADVKHSLRMFPKSPGFTLTAVAALALGIGANTAIFSIINAVLLKPIGLLDADRLVSFQTVTEQGPFTAGSPAKFQHWRQQTEVVQDVAAFRSNVVNFAGGGLPEQLTRPRSRLTTSTFWGRPSFWGARSPPTRIGPTGSARRC